MNFVPSMQGDENHLFKFAQSKQGAARRTDIGRYRGPCTKAGWTRRAPRICGVKADDERSALSRARVRAMRAPGHDENAMRFVKCALSSPRLRSARERAASLTMADMSSANGARERC